MKRMIKANSSVIFDVRQALETIVSNQNQSTEEALESVSNAFNISMDSAKELMICELGFSYSDFEADEYY